MNRKASSTGWLPALTAAVALLAVLLMLRGWVVLGLPAIALAAWLGLLTWLIQAQLLAEQLASNGKTEEAIARLEAAHRVARRAPFPSGALPGASPGMIRMRIAAMANRSGRPAVAERHLRDALLAEGGEVRQCRLEAGLAALLAEEGRAIEASERYHRLIPRLDPVRTPELLQATLAGAVASQLALEFLIEAELTDEAAPRGFRLRKTATASITPAALEAAHHLAHWAALRCDWGEARRWLTRAAELSQEVPQAPPELVLAVRTLSARVCAHAEDFEGGIAALEACLPDAVAQDERKGRPGWLEVHVGAELVELLVCAEQWERAEPIVDTMLASLDAYPGRPHAKATRLSYCKAVCRLAAGDTATALAQSETALTVLEQRGENESPETARHLLCIAAAASQLSDVLAAEAPLRRAMAIVELNPGGHFIPLVATLHAWGRSLAERGYEGEARPHLARALSICQRNLPSQHPYRLAMEPRLERMLTPT